MGDEPRDAVALTEVEAEERTRGNSFLRRFARQPLAVLGCFVLLFMVTIAVFAPFISRGVTPHTLEGNVISNPFFLQPNLQPTFDDFPLRIFGLTTLADFRQSVLVELVYGARTTLFIAFGGAAIASAIGIVVGSLSGYYGGVVDAFLMRVTDVFLSFPFFPLMFAILIATNSQPTSISFLVVVFGLAAWPQTARLLRAQMLSLRTQSYVEAAQVAGVSEGRIIFRHLLPNAFAPVVTSITQNIANILIAEATLEYLQLINLQAHYTYTWGSMIGQGERYLLQNVWGWTFFPGLCIVLTVLAVSYIGEGLRDAVDVRGQS
ncbi:MAG: ABC transporter permease [Ktedonobacterales bacterium]|nr:ABC transporter permease [Ktedonobacterales bacterium]